jgi:hypothetical protein
MGLVAPRETFDQDFRDISSVKTMPIGTYGETKDGRGYRYALAGGSTLDPGKLGVAATVNADATNKTVARTVAAGATEVIIDAGGAIAANVYNDGYLTINDATGEGISYLVAGHSVLGSSGELTVKLQEPLKVGLTIDVSEATLTQNPWSGVVISVADQADMPVGVPNVSITNAYYGWVQTKGVCAVLADETIGAGKAVVTGGSTVGAVEGKDTDDEYPEIGIALVAGVDTEYREIYLKID